MTNTSQLIEEFHSLPRNKTSRTLKRLNLYIAKVKENIQNEQELNAYVKSIMPRNALEYAFKIEILLQLRRTDQLLEELKIADAASIKKILKNKRFLTDAFSNMQCEIFFNTITPFVAHGTLVKILHRLPTVLNDKNLARQYFNTLLTKYDVYIAQKVLFACDIDFIRNAVEKYNIRLTKKELLALEKRDKGFLKFYFNILWKNNARVYMGRGYGSILRQIGKTDADFFWELYDRYKFNTPNKEIHLNEDVFDNLFVSNEKKATNRETCVYIFKPRVVFNTLIKRDKLHVLLVDFCQGDEDEFIKIYLQQDQSRLFRSFSNFIEKAPKYRYFYYLDKAYKLMFRKDLVDNPKLFNESLLKLTPINQRKVILDKLTLENSDLFYLYDIETSVRILKERLEHDKKNTDSYLLQLYETCRFHKNEKMLSQVLNYVVEKYRHEATIIDELSDKVLRWPNSERFDPEIWKAIDEIAKIIEYIDEVVSSTCFDLYLTNHIINSVTNDLPLDNFFKQMINRSTNRFMWFGTDMNSKILYETACKLTNYMCKKENLLKDLKVLLDSIKNFNAINKKDKISLMHYGHLVEMYAKQGIWYGDDYILNGAENNEHNSFHDQHWRRAPQYNHVLLPRYVESCPEEFLGYIVLVDAKMAASLTEDNFKNFSVMMKRELSKYCLDILKLATHDTDRICVAIIFLSLIDKDSFFNVITTNLTSLHEIDDKKHSIKKTISKCFLRMTYTPKILPIVLKIYKECEYKQYLGPIKGYFNKIPVKEAKVIIKSLSDDPVAHVRKLSLILTQDLLDRTELYDLIKELNAKETDVKVKRTLYKKAFFLFLLNQDDSHWDLLEKTIESGGVNPKYVKDLWAKLSKISSRYCEKYVHAILKAVTDSTESDENWKKELLMHLPTGTQDKLSGDFLVDLLKEVPFYTTKSRHTRHTHCFSIIPKDNYHLESAFYTSGEKQRFVFEVILRELEEYLVKNWDDFPDAEVFSNVYEFMRAFCKYTFKLKPEYAIVEKFYAKWTSLFSTYPQSKFLKLEFLNAYSECRYVIENFSKKSNEIMKIYVRRYGDIVLEVFCRELLGFVEDAKIYQFDFFNGFIKSNFDSITYSAVAEMLPEECTLYDLEQTKLQFLKDSLKSHPDKKIVRSQLSMSCDDEDEFYPYYFSNLESDD